MTWFQRCWHDAEEVPPPVGHTHDDPLLRPLKVGHRPRLLRMLTHPDQRGEIGVQLLPTGSRDIVPESEYEIVDRAFHGES
jgi:ubiquitin-conjugating enzyme E2 O